MHKQHPQTAYRKDAVLIGTFLKIAIEEELRISSDHAAFLTPAFLVAWINRASIAAAKRIPTGYATAVL